VIEAEAKMPQVRIEPKTKRVLEEAAGAALRRLASVNERLADTLRRDPKFARID